MALTYFEVSKGVEIYNDATETTIVLTQGEGTTDISGVSVTDLPVGSLFIDTLTGKLYKREGVTGVGITDWEVSANQSDLDAIGSGTSWKVPALVRDDTNYATLAAAVTAANIADTVDGETIAAGDRILLSNLTVGSDNIYVVSGSTGAWVFTVEVGPNDGDTVWIQTGTSADNVYVYNGAVWVLRGAGDQTELTNLRNFVGKTAAGAELPTYSSEHNVTTGDNLEVAIGGLDTAIGDRTYTADNIVTDGESVAASLDAIDGAIGDRTYTNDNVVTDGETITASIDAIDTALGSLLLGALEEDKGANQALSSSVIANATVTAGTAAYVTWQVLIRETTTITRQGTMEIQAMITDGGVVDFTVFAKNRAGPRVAGLSYDVTLAGGELQLVASANQNCDYTVQRIHTLQF